MIFDPTTRAQAGGIVELRGFNRTPPALLPELHSVSLRTPHPAACSWTDRREALRFGRDVVAGFVSGEEYMVG